MNLKEKFENYTQPVDESGWESIAKDHGQEVPEDHSV